MQTVAPLILPPLEVPLKVFADGSQADASDPRLDHVALHYVAGGFMVHPVSLGDGSDSANRCEELCRELRVLGHDDWQLAPDTVWDRYVTDRRFRNPAVDPNLYPGIKPGWHWTSTDVVGFEPNASGRSPYAWLVLASGGLVYDDSRDFNGFALAVRRVGQ